MDELLLKLSSYPLSNYRYFIAAQKVVAEQYHKLLKYRWQEGIYRAMQGLVETEFEYKDGVHLEEENIDPTLRQIFQQVKLQRQSVLRQAFEVSSSHYLEFLLGFLLRDPSNQ